MNGKKIIGMNECKNDQKRLEKEQNHQIKRKYALKKFDECYLFSHSIKFKRRKHFYLVMLKIILKDKNFLAKCDHIEHGPYVDGSAVLVTQFCAHLLQHTCERMVY